MRRPAYQFWWLKTFDWNPFHIFGANTSRSKQAEEWQLVLAFFQNLQETFAPVDVPQPQSSLEPGMATMLRLRRVDTSKWEKKIVFSMKIAIWGHTMSGQTHILHWWGATLKSTGNRGSLEGWSWAASHLGQHQLNNPSIKRFPAHFQVLISRHIPKCVAAHHPVLLAFNPQLHVCSSIFIGVFRPRLLGTVLFCLRFPIFVLGFSHLSQASTSFPQFFPWILPDSAFPHGFSHVFSTVSPWISPCPLGHIEVLTYAAAADACALGRMAAPLTELLEVLPRRALSNLQNLRKGTGDGWYPRYWVNMWVIWIGMWYQKNLYSKIYPRDWLVWWIVDIMD